MSVDEANSKRVEPVFFLNNEVEQDSGTYLDTLEVCLAVCEVVSDESVVEGAQRIGGLWRIYLTDEEVRARLLCTGINLRNIQITLKDRNPFLLPGHEYVETTRLYIRNIPLSYDNDVITNTLKNMGVQMLGNLKYVRARTSAGKLTNFKTGDRFVDIVVPSEPLPKKKSMGLFTASLYHKEQKQTQSEIECGNCRQTGHVRRNCQNESVYYDCLKPGHKRGSPLCTGMQSIVMAEDNEKVVSLEDENKKEDEGDEGEDEDDDDYSADESDGNDTGSNEEEKTGEKEENSQGGEKENSQGNKAEKEKSKSELAQKQKLLSDLWAAGAPCASVAGRSASPARVRKVGDRTPDEKSEQKKQQKKKKAAQNK